MKIPSKAVFHVENKIVPPANQPLVPINLAWREIGGACGIGGENISYSSGFVWTSSSYSSSSSSSSSYSSSLEKKKDYEPQCPSEEACSFVETKSAGKQEAKHQRQESHHLSLVKLGYLPYHQNNVSSVETLWTWEKQAHIALYVMANTLCVLFVNKRGPPVYCLKGGSFAILGYILGSVHGKGNMKGAIRILNKCAQ